MAIGRLIRLLVRRPGATLAALTALSVWGAVAINAVALQGGPHPAPLLGDAEYAGSPIALSRDRSAAPTAEEEEARRQEDAEKRALVADLQELLTQRGFYAGDVDGAMGPKTEEAIRAFQQKADLEVTGEPNVALLAHIQMSSHTAQPLPGGRPDRVSRADDDIGANEDAGSEPGSASTLTEDDLALELPGAEEENAPAADPKVEAVQRVLADLGYAPGRIDGQMGPETEAAIRRFQRDRGISPTGELDDRLLRELSNVSDQTFG